MLYIVETEVFLHKTFKTFLFYSINQKFSLQINQKFSLKYIDNALFEEYICKVKLMLLMVIKLVLDQQRGG